MGFSYGFSVLISDSFNCESNRRERFMFTAEINEFNFC
jgi:hypothetical protein